MRILVIDDEPDVLLLCRVNLEIAGHEVLEAGNGERGLALAVGERPDVIVLDVMLPAKDGLTVLGELSADERTSEIPVVLLTAMTQVEDRLAGWRAGCTDYITKPFSPVDLAETIQQIHEMSVEERARHRDLALSKLGQTG